jgi:hypothetical protein
MDTACGKFRDERPSVVWRSFVPDSATESHIVVTQGMQILR